MAPIKSVSKNTSSKNSESFQISLDLRKVIPQKKKATRVYHCVYTRGACVTEHSRSSKILPLLLFPSPENCSTFLIKPRLASAVPHHYFLSSRQPRKKKPCPISWQFYQTSSDTPDQPTTTAAIILAHTTPGEEEEGKFTRGHNQQTLPSPFLSLIRPLIRSSAQHCSAAGRREREGDEISCDSHAHSLCSQHNGAYEHSLL
ncbi:hypothetical protein BV898_13227 [Hypsibius exemplaris]|uniref:Uncharacterized protein n=1 Tax=Hypsibius exemplaris TaxID=2072580 RepID=A0A1W0WBC4_HYPEX|nr:hypothetical protein BV898_13227 [Hypsibius exemplaris]